MVWLVAIASGILTVLFNNDERLLKQEETFKYTYDYCRKNLKNFYFNDIDCKTVSNQLERDKMLQSELDYLLRSNSVEDSIQMLINRGKITL